MAEPRRRGSQILAENYYSPPQICRPSAISKKHVPKEKQDLYSIRKYNHSVQLKKKIRDVESFIYKTEIKIIYFVPLCLIVLTVSDPKFFVFKKYQKLDIKNLGSW
jgi:hypothetical protein